MIGLDKLTPKQIEVLRQMVFFTCQNCERHEDEVGTLIPHRLIRANIGGKYCPNNVLMVCEECHKLYHANEFGQVKSK